jgi:adenylosuccinate lyase
MIARYSRPDMAAIWGDRHRYQVWLKVELAVCEELAKERKIPAKDWRELRRKGQALLREGGVSPDRVDFHERVTRHDVIAFTTAVAEKIGPISRYIHFGLTSSDVVDTSLSLLIQEAGRILLADVDALLDVLKKKALQYRTLPTIGRSHGIFAEPTVFGLKFLGWYAEWRRNRERLSRALEQVRVGKLSGAVGVNAHGSPQFEARVLERLKLEREPVSTQVIPRDRHAELLSVIALCGSSLERIAVELRHLQRSEVAEVLEGFKKGQKGSSAMPHKRNPISSENLTGAARLLRSYAGAALEDVALWHERDISHSSVERVVLPDATILLDYALHRMTGILKELVVRKEQVRANLEKAGTTSFSGHFLLALVQEGATREQAYGWVQSCALASFERKGDFVALLAKHPEVRKRLTPKQIRELGSVRHQLRHSEAIYRAVLGSQARGKRR